MENFVSTKTVVGEPITVGNITIVPLIDLSFGVGAGGSGSKGEKDSNGKNAGGLGAKITPSAIVVIQNDTVQLINVKNTGSVDKLLNMVPGIISKFNFKNDSDSSEKQKSESDDEYIV